MAGGVAGGASDGGEQKVVGVGAGGVKAGGALALGGPEHAQQTDRPHK